MGYTQTNCIFPTCKHYEVHGLHVTCNSRVEGQLLCGQLKFLFSWSAASLTVEVSVDLQVSADIAINFVDYTRWLD